MQTTKFSFLKVFNLCGQNSLFKLFLLSPVHEHTHSTLWLWSPRMKTWGKGATLGVLFSICKWLRAPPVAPLCLPRLIPQGSRPLTWTLKKYFLFWDHCKLTCGYNTEKQYRDNLYALHLVFPNGNILHNYNTWSEPGNRHWYSSPTFFRFCQVYIYDLCVCVCVHAHMCMHLVLCNFIMCRSMWPPPQSRYKTVPA